MCVWRNKANQHLPDSCTNDVVHMKLPDTHVQGTALEHNFKLKMCQRVAPHRCLKTPDISSTRMPTITYIPNHTGTNDSVSSRLKVVQTGNTAQFAGLHAHGDQPSMVAASSGSHIAIEGRPNQQHPICIHLSSNMTSNRIVSNCCTTLVLQVIGPTNM